MWFVMGRREGALLVATGSRDNRARVQAVKRLFQSSAGPLEVELHFESGIVSVSVFDASGAVVRETDTDWEDVDLVRLLRDEIGLDEAESQTIAARFHEDARAAGVEQPPQGGAAGGVAACGCFALVVLVVLAGVWTLVNALGRLF